MIHSASNDEMPSSMKIQHNSDGPNEEDDDNNDQQGFSFDAKLFENIDHLGLPDFNKIDDTVEPDRPAINYSNPNSNQPINFSNSPEIAGLFSKISEFQPPDLDITPHFKPFLPDLVPSIGAIDAFIKVPRPDAQMDQLGLVLLDEPSIGQMDPQIFKMELREKFNVMPQGNNGDSYIGTLKPAELENSKAMNSFLSSIEEIHRNRPPPSITYSTKMPEFEELMDVWPPEIEELLQTIPLPNAEMDLSVEEYVRVICAILEIPVKGNMIESLHHLFSLFAQFEGNTYFQSQDNSKP